MNTPSIGMSDEELIQWLIAHAPVREKSVRSVFPGIEAFCAKTPVGLPNFIETLARMTSNGIPFRRAVNAIKERCA